VPNKERRRVVIESARRLVPFGIDVLKAEFPLNVKESQDRAEWADACAELSSVCPVPWVLLSAGVDFETYLAQVEVACEAGASGILCGRTVWMETTQLDELERMRFLQTTASDRFRRLATLVSESARPYTDFYPATNGEELENWYRISNYARA
jgi:tagatose-1,6-bisphosphate aldolase